MKKLGILGLLLGLVVASSGCAVTMRAAPPRAVVYEEPVYYQQPVYVQPAPVYVQPPVYRQPHRHYPQGGYRHCNPHYQTCR